ncbi:MAG: hypothetical protein NVS3B29_00660 [Candidatus Saccharimonadales bacterium]
MLMADNVELSDALIQRLRDLGGDPASLSLAQLEALSAYEQPKKQPLSSRIFVSFGFVFFAFAIFSIFAAKWYQVIFWVVLAISSEYFGFRIVKHKVLKDFNKATDEKYFDEINPITTNVLVQKYFEIVVDEVGQKKHSDSFKVFLSSIKGNKTKDICLVGYILRKAEKELTRKTIPYIRPAMTKLALINNENASKIEEIANYLDETHTLGLGERAAHYTLLPVESVNEALEILVEEVLKSNQPKHHPDRDRELLFRYMCFGYLYHMAEEIYSITVRGERRIVL